MNCVLCTNLQRQTLSCPVSPFVSRNRGPYVNFAKLENVMIQKGYLKLRLGIEKVCGVEKN